MNTLTETSVRLFASPKSWVEGEAVSQLYATTKLDGMRQAVGFPDLHPGKGSPVGAAFVTNTVTVLADPTAPYPVAVLADSPIAYFRLSEASNE